jgi:hypothetical protein
LRENNGGEEWHDSCRLGRRFDKHIEIGSVELVPVVEKTPNFGEVARKNQLAITIRAKADFPFLGLMENMAFLDAKLTIPEFFKEVPQFSKWD